MTKLDADYTYHLAMGSHGLAQQLTRLETNPARKKRKGRVVKKKTELLVSTYSDELRGLDEAAQFSALPSRVGRHEDEDTRRTLLIDLTFSDPFAPYELTFKKSDMDAALGAVAATLGLTAGDVAAIRSTQAAATRAHYQTKAIKMAAVGAGAAVILATTAWFALPVIAASIGAAAGLSGTAATNFGMALLGSGSLAAGGFGMAGGMVVVTGVGAVAGFSGASGAMVMMELGAARSRAELIKLQVTYREVLLRNQADMAKAQKVTTDLARQHEELRAVLAEERDLNDRNAHRVKDLEQTIEAVDKSLAWMRKQKAA